MTPPLRELTRGGLLARNVALNIGGIALPALAALIAVPLLVTGMGTERFGLVALAWTTLGYFSLFDLGVGRAVTHAVAESASVEGHPRSDAGTILWTAIAIITPVGLAGGVALATGASWLTQQLDVHGALARESIVSLRILAIAIPFAVLTGAIRGALEGRQHFGAVNALRVPHGLITFLGPVAVLPFSRSVVPAMVFITAGRAVLCIAHYVVARRVIPEFGATPAFVTTIARRLVGFGGWLQVTYVVSPLMATLDRFVVGAVLGLGMVAFYATPTELVTKLWLFVFATSPVFFSAFTTTALRDPERTTLLFDRMLRLTVAVLFVPALVLVALAPEILRLWLGPEFVAPSTRVMQVLTVAVFVNCAGQAAYTLVQALGRPDITGKYHLVELPVYALLLWILLPPYGILGVAIAWALRTVGDSVLLFATCPRLLRPSAAPIARISMWLVATSGIMLAALWLDGTIARLALVVAASGGWSMLTWRYLLTPDERQLALSKILTLPALSR